MTSFIFTSLNFEVFSSFTNPDFLKFSLNLVFGIFSSDIIIFLFFTKFWIYFPKYFNSKLYLLESTGSCSIFSIPKAEKGKKRTSFSSGNIDISSISA